MPRRNGPKRAPTSTTRSSIEAKSVKDADRLAKLAMKIRGHYCFAVRWFYEQRTGQVSYYGRRRIPKWDGGTDEAGKKHVPYWPKLAIGCLESRLQPRRLVKVLFQRHEGSTPPFPTQLLSDNNRRAYAEYQKGEIESVRLELALQQQVFATSMSHYVHTYRKTPELAAKLALVDSDQDWLPVFAYIQAKELGIKDLAAEWKTKAVYAYMFDEEIYDKVYGGKIPAALKTAAGNLRRSLFEGV